MTSRPGRRRGYASQCARACGLLDDGQQLQTELRAMTAKTIERDVESERRARGRVG